MAGSGLFMGLSKHSLRVCGLPKAFCLSLKDATGTSPAGTPLAAAAKTAAGNDNMTDKQQDRLRYSFHTMRDSPQPHNNCLASSTPFKLARSLATLSTAFTPVDGALGGVRPAILLTHWQDGHTYCCTVNAADERCHGTQADCIVPPRVSLVLLMRTCMTGTAAAVAGCLLKRLNSWLLLYTGLRLRLLLLLLLYTDWRSLSNSWQRLDRCSCPICAGSTVGAISTAFCSSYSSI